MTFFRFIRLHTTIDQYLIDQLLSLQHWPILRLTNHFDMHRPDYLTCLGPNFWLTNDLMSNLTNQFDWPIWLLLNYALISFSFAQLYFWSILLFINFTFDFTTLELRLGRRLLVDNLTTSNFLDWTWFTWLTDYTCTTYPMDLYLYDWPNGIILVRLTQQTYTCTIWPMDLNFWPLL